MLNYLIKDHRFLSALGVSEITFMVLDLSLVELLKNSWKHILVNNYMHFFKNTFDNHCIFIFMYVAQILYLHFPFLIEFMLLRFCIYIFILIVYDTKQLTV